MNHTLHNSSEKLTAGKIQHARK